MIEVERVDLNVVLGVQSYMLLSLCMIVRNESKHLERCLRSAKGVADQIVVVDTGSTDGTPEIARRLGAEVHDFPWVDDFARARNQALERARAPWVLVLDADEQLLARDHQALLQLLREHTPTEGSPGVAFNLLVNNSSDGGRTGVLAHIIRLFPNRADVRYESPIHEQVGPSLLRRGIQILDTKIEILHDGYAEPVRNEAKQRRNLAILEKQVAGGGVAALSYYLLGGARLDLGDYSGAIATYEECIRRAGEGDPFLQAARVRVASCLYKLGRFTEVRDAICMGSGTGREHPEQLVLLGSSLKALGELRGALEALCGVLAFEEGVFLPPCNLTSVKIEAVLGVASMLKEQGDEASAVKLMRAAVERRAAGRPLNLAWISALLPQRPA